MALFGLLLGILLMAGAMAASQMKLNFLNFVAFPITFGNGVDYGVNVLRRWKRPFPPPRECRATRSRCQKMSPPDENCHFFRGPEGLFAGPRPSAQRGENHMELALSLIDTVILALIAYRLCRMPSLSARTLPASKRPEP